MTSNLLMDSYVFSKYIPLERLPVAEPLNEHAAWSGHLFEQYIDLTQSIKHNIKKDQGCLFSSGQSHSLDIAMVTGSYHLSMAPTEGHGRSQLVMNMTIQAHQEVELLLTHPEDVTISWAALEGRIIIEPKAKLKITFMLPEKIRVPLTSAIECIVMEDACLNAFCAVFDGDFQYQALIVKLHQRAQASIHGISLTDRNQYRGFEAIVHHLSPEATSNITMRCIATGPSKTLIHGLIQVYPGAKDTRAAYKNNNLMLSDKASIIAQPELDIQFDDVACAHGVTLGTLDEQALFYLQARGITLQQAKKLLIYSFGQEILNAAPSSIPFDLPALFSNKLENLLDDEQ